MNIKKFRRELSGLTDEKRFIILMSIFHDLKEEIMIKEGECDDMELILTITRQLGKYEDYLAMAAQLLIDE